MHNGRVALTGYYEKVGGGVEGTHRVKLVWRMKYNLTLPEGNLFFVAFDQNSPLVNVNHFPKIVSLASENKALVKLVVMHRYYTGDVYYAFGLCSYVCGPHKIPSLSRSANENAHITQKNIFHSAAKWYIIVV